MNTIHRAHSAIRKVAHAASMGALSLALAMTMVPAQALAATDLRGGVHR